MDYCNTHGCKIAGFLMLLFGFRVSSGELNCYSGSLDRTKATLNHSLTQQTCAAIDLHQMNLTDGNISSSLNHPELRNISSEDLKFCLVFMYQNSTFEHSCAHNNICETNGVHQKVDYKGQQVTVFCCQSDLCNTYEKAAEETNQSSICYTDSGVDNFCGRSRCMNQTTVALNGTTEYKFGCASETIYNPNSPVKDECHETPSSTGRTTTCFCTGNHCNHPAVYVSSPATPVSTTPTLLLYLTPPAVRQGRARSWGFIATVAAVVLLIVLLLVLVVFVVRRFREHRAQHVTYTYTQLTADLAEERDTDDEYMLIG